MKMNRISLKSIVRLIGFGLKTNRKKIFGWCIAIFLITLIYMSLFPYVKDMAQIKFDAMPKEVMQLMGIEDMSYIGDYSSYFGTIYNLLLIAISIFMATFSIGLIVNEERNNTIEFLYSLEISRSEIYISKLLVSFISLILVEIVVVIPAIVCGIAVGGDGFELFDFILAFKIASFTPFVFMAIGFLLGGISSKISGGISAMFVLVTYFTGYLSAIIEDKAEWLAYFSPLQLFNSNNAMNADNKLYIELGVYLTISAICLITGGILYKKRDFFK